jgi:hypothetical protein
MTFSMAGRIRWWNNSKSGAFAGGEQIATTIPRRNKAELPFMSSEVQGLRKI